MGVAAKHKVVTTSCCLGIRVAYRRRCFANDKCSFATLRKKQKRIEICVVCYETDFGRCHSCKKIIVPEFNLKRLDTLRSPRFQNKSERSTVRPREVIIGDLATDIVLNKVKTENKETFARLYCGVVGL